MRALTLSLLGAAALALTGCGFTPLYAEPGVAAGLAGIAVTTEDSRLGFTLRGELEDELGVSGGVPLWRLQVEPAAERRPLGRRIDDTAVRYELTLRGKWTLTPASGGEPLVGEEAAVVTYESADQPYAAIAAAQDGESRAAAELARLIRLDIARRLAERSAP